MAEVVKVPYEGDLADAEQVSIDFPDSLSHEMTMPDGKVLKMNMTIGNVFRLLNKKDEEGEAIYVFNVQVKVAKVTKASNDALTKEPK